MDNTDDIPTPQKVRLTAGAQAVINGALVTAVGPCELEVGAGSFVLTGRWAGRSPAAMRAPREELYFSMLDASVDDERFAESRFRLFGLLAQVVAQERSYQGQRECSSCAAAIMAGDIDESVRSAARLASDRFAQRPRGVQFERGGRMGARAVTNRDLRA
ncbi:MAG: hypothetical protein QNJ15_00020 [Erythrobacter sp.]|nr:hypothetical protein [Erythrobacter sp.]